MVSQRSRRDRKRLRITIWRATVVVQAVLLALGSVGAGVLAVVGTGGGCASGPNGAICVTEGQGFPWIVIAPCLLAIAVAEVFATVWPYRRVQIPVRLAQFPIAVPIVVMETMWASNNVAPLPTLLGLGALAIAAVVAYGPGISVQRTPPIADKKTRGLVVVLGVPLSLVGAGGCLLILGDIQRERMGRCDFVACTSATTAPAFRLALGGLIAGVVMLGLAITAMNTRARLAAIGFPLSLVGAWASLPLLRNILQKDAAHCGYTCVSTTTVLLLVLAIGGFIAGVVMLGLTARLKPLDAVH